MSTYGDAHAAWYDALYESLGKDHVTEARDLLSRVTAQLGHAPTSWLDVACGTGQHLAAVADAVDEVVGVDLSEAMLDVARARLGGRVELRVADQRTLDLGRRFEVVSSLFSSIGYAADLDELDATVAALARHVAPGGVLVLEPWVDPADWEDGRTQVVDVEEADLRAVRVITSRREGDLSVLEVAVVSAAAGRLTVEREDHRMLLVPRDRLLASVRAAGLDPSWDDPAPQGDGPTGRGLVIGVQS
ncbi:class I SAM-dependent methyltransferase [Nitriliruptor alkaliphilus]|uniref:class I SAM-dependent methyltransferase n=1 Tax=Nitriliruptor alkaliphilus TaxID=427918 RepID=UPI000697835C|nr:class I SAM-dependent methyltransferase [Nitriliruptor alkaliphilus]